MTEPAVQTIVILGNGVAGWMTAATLAARLPRRAYRIVVVELVGGGDGLGEFGTGLTITPAVQAFHASLGIDETMLIQTGRGSFSLGTAFSGWSARETTYFLPFGGFGAALGPVGFHQLLARLRDAGRSVRGADYSIAAIAAQAGRFARPVADGGSVLSQYSYALHLDAAAYCTALRATAAAHGVATAAAPYRRAILAADGTVAALELADGTLVEAMLFIDASGAAARLSSEVLGDAFEGWRAWLPCDRFAGSRTAERTPPPPFSHVEASANGWRASTPLAGETTRLDCWSSAAEGPEVTAIAFENGRRKTPWLRNCVAIGAAACMLEPLRPTALQLIQQAITRLITLFPAGPHAPVEAGEYNRLTNEECDRTRDFLIAHYLDNGRHSDPMWNMLQSTPLPEPLAHKRAQFLSGGRVPMYDGELFEEQDWLTLFEAQGLRPRRYNALAAAVPMARIDEHCARLRDAIIAGAKALPSHAEYLRNVHATPARGVAA